MSEAERQQVLTVSRSPEFCDLAPAQVRAQLLDDGTYPCSIATMNRLPASAGENRDGRRQRTHPAKKKPELMAAAANPVWSWDITKLRGPERGVYYELFVIIDIHSRYVIAWCVAATEIGEQRTYTLDAAHAANPRAHETNHSHGSNSSWPPTPTSIQRRYRADDRRGPNWPVGR
jgi:transposase InsO family protein